MLRCISRFFSNDGPLSAAFLSLLRGCSPPACSTPRLNKHIPSWDETSLPTSCAPECSELESSQCLCRFSTEALWNQADFQVRILDHPIAAGANPLPAVTATLWLGLDSRVNPPTPMMTCQRVQPAPVPLITVGNNPYTPGTLMICTRSVHPTPFDPGTHASPAIHQNSSQGKPRLTLLHITTPHNYMSPEPTRHKPKSATFCTNAAMFA